MTSLSFLAGRTVAHILMELFHIFLRTPDIDYDFKTNSGDPFSYFVYGAGCSEVEIDCLTGDHLVNRVFIIIHHECH